MTKTISNKVGDQVIFDEGDGEHTSSLGVITRLWPNGKYVTVISDGRTFVRCADRVNVCRSQPETPASIETDVADCEACFEAVPDEDRECYHGVFHLGCYIAYHGWDFCPSVDTR